MREGVLFDDVHVPSGDTAAGIDVAAEVRACHRLKGLRLTQIGVATGHDPTGVYITNKEAYDRGNRAIVACHVGHPVQGDGSVLAIRNPGEVLRALIHVRPTDDRAASRTGGTAICDIVYKGKDYLVIDSSGARLTRGTAFHPTRPGER